MIELLVLTATLLQSEGGSNRESNPVELLIPGLLHGEEVQSSGGQDWWGLYPDPAGTGAELRPVTVSIVPEHDPIVDDEGQATGKLVSVNTADSPLMLFRGLPSAKAGPVCTVTLDTQAPFPGQILNMASTSLAYHDFSGGNLVAYGKAEASSVGPVLHEFRLVLYPGSPTEGQPQQTIYEQDQLDLDAHPHVIWAGDLDGDKKLDLLLDLTTHYNLSIPTLLLSTRAKAGELVGLAGQIVLSGC